MNICEKESKTVLGIFAHVDGGKTTFSEELLYKCGAIKNLGRVDHGNSSMDFDKMERERGISIFSKQASFKYKDSFITIIDTPGHVDFRAEMERAIDVIDYALLIISVADFPDAYSKRIWELLRDARKPVFIFVNKMDRSEKTKDEIRQMLKSEFLEEFIECPESKDLSDDELESMAVLDENLLEKFLDSGNIEEDDKKRLIYERKLFPLYFGSALKSEGIDEFLDGFNSLYLENKYPSKMGARVLRIRKDEKGEILTFLKLTGGKLSIKDELLPGEKINEIRLYVGNQYKNLDFAYPGMLVALTGIKSLRPGDGIGFEKGRESKNEGAFLKYIIKSPDVENLLLYRKLSELYMEFPELYVNYNEKLREISIRLAGDMQIEVFKHIVRDRFGFNIEFDEGSILYLETIEDKVEGVGHFEPLRHYAEVHLLLEPLERGEGLKFSADIPVDTLSLNWQRLIYTHLKEKTHRGVLINAPITDMKISLLTGAASAKHTSGGDFREATYRAIRQGLMMAKSIILEPYLDFTIRIPTSLTGTLMNDISLRSGKMDPPENHGDETVIKGYGPAIEFRNYERELRIMTRGEGRIELSFKSYLRAHNESEIILNASYDPENDYINPCSSVFCAHGSGFMVPYDKVYKYMHLESGLIEKKKEIKISDAINIHRKKESDSGYIESGQYIGDQELEEIFVKTYGPIKDRHKAFKREIAFEKKKARLQNKESKYENMKFVKRKNYLLVDAYNIIYSWDFLKDLAEHNMGAARTKLLDIMSNYAGYTDKEVIVVFDAYRVKDHAVEKLEYHNIYAVFTKEAMTADQYIEETVINMKESYNVTVATSDKVVRIISFAQGALLLSAEDLLLEIRRVEKEIRDRFL